MLFTIKIFHYDLQTAAEDPAVARALLNGVENNKFQGHYDFPNNGLVIDYLEQRSAQ